jgi:hypothetical protein
MLESGEPAIVLGDQLTAWTATGYGARHARPTRGSAQVITPPASLAALRAGYPVQVDASAAAT